MKRYVLARKFKNFTQGVIYTAKPMYYNEGSCGPLISGYLVLGREIGYEDVVAVVDFVKHFQPVEDCNGK